MSINSLSKIAEENPNPIIRLSKQGRVLYGNKASNELLDCWGMRASEFIREHPLKILYRSVESQSPISEDFKCHDRVFTVTFTPISGTNYVNAYAMDTTDKKDMENALQTALEEVRRLRNRLQEENRYLREEIKEGIGFDTLVGESDAITGLTHKIKQVATTDSTVLITGETGTGKEIIARAIHAHSRRRGLPLIKINCAALPIDLIESELFGHQKGAFTGAIANKVGRFELANGGTLFLDEIGDLPLASQSKLLRALQEREFERVGGTKTIHVDVRVIAATNRVLDERIAADEFREDLYYRLNVFPIHSPPLREHIEDIPDLACHILDKYTKKVGRPVKRIEAAVMRRLQSYYWPGNVRELENIIERGVILTEGNSLQLDDSFDLNRAPLPNQQKTLEEVEQDMIQVALEKSCWKIEGQNGAARRLAVAPSTLRERIKKYGLQRHQQTDETSFEPI